MKGIAISTGSLPKAPLVDQLTLARELGYTAVEIVAAASPLPLVGSATELRELLDARGLTLVGWYPHPLNPQPDAVDTNLEKVVADGILASEAGCDLVVFPPLPPRETCDLARLDTLLREALRRLPTTTRIAIENHHPWPFMYPEDYLRLFERIDDPRLGVAFDTGHFVASEVDRIEALKTLWSRVFHVHLKDQVGTVGRWFGQGDAGLPAVLRCLREEGYDGWLTVEMELPNHAETVPAVKAARTYVEAELAAFG